MAIKSLSRSSIENNIFYRSILAGNAAFSPSSYDLLETQVVTSSVASVTFTGLDAYSDYKHLQIAYSARSATGDYQDRLKMQWNGLTSNYASIGMFSSGSTSPSSTSGTNQSGFYVASASSPFPAAFANAALFGSGIIDIPDPHNASKLKTISSRGGTSNTGQVRICALMSGLNTQQAAMTSMTFLFDFGNIAAGTRFSLLGLKG